jgi:hypothetical protein
LLAPVFRLPAYRKEKWVTPKPADIAPSPVKRTVLHRTEPAKPRQPRPQAPVLTDDPEQWGQYYFRDAILDQLDVFWVYLKRMKIGDRDSYDLLHQIGIQMVPWSATHNFDKWLGGSESVELSPWWRQHRPGFGAIAYGFDDIAASEDRWTVQDSAEPGPAYEYNDVEKRLKAEGAMGHRPVYFGDASRKFDKRTEDKPHVIWTPRFLYFRKMSKPHPAFERVSGGDTYYMTVYWDRNDKKIHKQAQKRRGGVPQEYGVFVEHNTGRVRILKTKLHEKITIKWSKGPYGGKCLEPAEFINTHWEVPDRYLSWSHRDLSGIEPEDYLRRLFINAANLYESASLGSIVRVAVHKGLLTATFGVEARRMAHFFRDRDVAVTTKGRRRPVLRMVRAHVRKNGTPVKTYFSGMKKFTWAGYNVEITVPGKDHFHMVDMTIGAEHALGRQRADDRSMDNEKFGKFLINKMNQGFGGQKR